MTLMIIAVVTHTVLVNPEGYLISGILFRVCRARDVSGHTVVTTPTVKSDATTDGTNCSLQSNERKACARTIKEKHRYSGVPIFVEKEPVTYIGSPVFEIKGKVDPWELKRKAVFLFSRGKKPKVQRSMNTHSDCRVQFATTPCEVWVFEVLITPLLVGTETRG